LVLQILGLHGWEWLIILFVVLLLFGASKIPEVARSLGRAVGEFQKARMQVDREIRAAMQEPASERGSARIPQPLSSGPQPPSERGRLLAAARSLGVSVREDASEEELRAHLKDVLEKS
jgi:sec-independent protein translocase protein TatA